MSFVLFIAILIFGSSSHALCAESQKLERIRMGYSSISSSRIALWATNDMGFFRKNGLAAEVIVTPGVQGTQASSPASYSFISAASIRRPWRPREVRIWSPWPLQSRSNTS